MTADSVNQLTKHLQDIMQKEFDSLNKEIGLDEKYYTKKINEVAEKSKLEESCLTNKSLDSPAVVATAKAVEDDEDLNDDSVLVEREDDDNFEAAEAAAAGKINNKSALSDDNNNSINDEDNKKA